MSEERQVIRKAEKPQRKPRISLTGERYKLTVTGQEPGFHYAWVDEKRIGAAEDAWYEFVTHSVMIGDSHIDVGSIQGGRIMRNAGSGQILYLMRIPEEFYKEDQDIEAKKVDATEEQIFIESNSNGLSGTIQIGNRQLGKR